MMAVTSETAKYEVLEKIGMNTWSFVGAILTKVISGHGAFGVIRKVKRKSDGHVCTLNAEKSWMRI